MYPAVGEGRWEPSGAGTLPSISHSLGSVPWSHRPRALPIPQLAQDTSKPLPVPIPHLSEPETPVVVNWKIPPYNPAGKLTSKIPTVLAKQDVCSHPKHRPRWITLSQHQHFHVSLFPLFSFFCSSTEKSTSFTPCLYFTCAFFPSSIPIPFP